MLHTLHLCVLYCTIVQHWSWMIHVCYICRCQVDSSLKWYNQDHVMNMITTSYDKRFSFKTDNRFSHFYLKCMLSTCYVRGSKDNIPHVSTTLSLMSQLMILTRLPLSNCDHIPSSVLPPHYSCTCINIYVVPTSPHDVDIWNFTQRVHWAFSLVGPILNSCW